MISVAGDKRTAVAEKRGSAFLKKVIQDTPNGERIAHCMQCGCCSGSCPSGPDMDHTPRSIIALISADQKQTVLESNTMWFCVSCYFCTTRCPQEIPITDIMYSLKRQAIASGNAIDSDAPAMAKVFTNLLDKYGRSFEFGLATRYHLLNRPLSLLKMGPMGMSMFTKGRMSLIPSKIRQIDQLQAIIKKAKELGDAS